LRAALAGLRDALAVAQALESIARVKGLDAELDIKWPNDVSPAASGVLIERTTARKPTELVGVGINVNLDASAHSEIMASRPAPRSGRRGVPAKSAVFCNGSRPYDRRLAAAPSTPGRRGW
jgi:biotin-(acetyl-CoA carboxylase) ligase